MDLRHDRRTRRARTLTILIACALGLAALAPAASADRGSTGLGIIVGEPTGISFKQWLDGRNAIDAAAAWSFADEGAAHLHLDYLWHFFDRIEDVESGSFPLYIGIGGRVKFDEDDALLGARIPLGVNFILDEAPFDFFLEVVPILDLAPDTDFRLNAALGARYYFD